MFVPDPVISLSITPKNKETASFSKAMNRFQREDPTFRCKVDPESQETIISGMGELHLEIYVERLRREYGIDCTTGKPEVAYRETIDSRVDFDYVFKRQTGGAGDYARVMGYMEPTRDPEGKNHFEEQIVGGHISEKFLYACEKVSSPLPRLSLPPLMSSRASKNPSKKVLCSATACAAHA